MINITHFIQFLNVVQITRKFTLIILIAIVCVIAFAQEPKEKNPFGTDMLLTNPMSGRIVFEEKGCINCHAIEGFGGDIGPDLAYEKFYGSFYDLASRLWNHAPQMTVRSDVLREKWPTLTSTELNQLVSYLFFLRYLGEPGNISNGKKLIRTKGCMQCHQIGNEGPQDGIALDQLQEYASPLYVAQVIWNHGPTMQEEITEMGLERPVFENQDITHISAYLREFSRSQSAHRQYMSPGNPIEGARLFQEKGCSYCHAVKEDQPSAGTRLSEMNLHRSVTDIAGTMWNHGNTMRETMVNEGIDWPVFQAAEMADLIAYLYFYDYQSSPGDPKAGKNVYQTKSCNDCHGPKEEYAFGETIEVTNPSDLVCTMWNHVPYMHELMTTKNVYWPELSSEELRDLYAFLHNWSLKK